ncbi:hypothetical protein [Escherichia coli]|nr:hypothetical protein [Escherichia coli]
MTWPEAFTTVGIAVAVAVGWWCIRFAAGDKSPKKDPDTNMSRDL